MRLGSSPLPEPSGGLPRMEGKGRLLLLLALVAVAVVAVALAIGGGWGVLARVAGRKPTPTSLGMAGTPSPSPVSPSPRPSDSPVPPSPTSRPTLLPTATPPLNAGGAVLLDDSNTDRYVLEAGVLLHPHGLVLLHGNAYLIDAGQLVSFPLLEDGPATRLFPPDGQVEGIQIGELIALARSPAGEGLILLDKRGDLYRYDPAGSLWSVEQLMDQRRDSPNPVPCALASYNGRVYLLDSSYKQVWRHPFDEVGEAYLPGDGDADLYRGIDLGVDGDVFVLLRQGMKGPAGLIRFAGAPASRDSGFAAGLLLETPTRLYLGPESTDPIYLIDRDGRRLQSVDRETGEVVGSFAFAGDRVEMRAVEVREGRLYIAASDALYVYPGSGQIHFVSGGQGPLPAERPDNPERLAALGSFTLPIAGMRYLPDRDSFLPGSPRVYRYGIHEGLDLYGGTVGIEIPYGTEVLAAADGVVIRADQDYQAMTMPVYNELVALCASLHRTPADVLDLLRGRQVWIDHGNGLVTRYVHLAGIPDDVVTGTTVLRGQVIGYAGNSGTSEEAEGGQRGVHLHFEVMLDGPYLGEGLSLIETRRLLQRLLFP